MIFVHLKVRSMTSMRSSTITNVLERKFADSDAGIRWIRNSFSYFLFPFLSFFQRVLPLLLDLMSL